ncbi:MAG: chromosome partitioning protein ParB [Pantoea sp.]|uniref:ParB/RepB/Spo0J family partition protein n=1 Tax=Pantoea sp. TaxID=69393 RepID=UPI0029157166|nr:chromosome partitioning protein ParB [Pantoea sp.]MDU7840629.1 chromosome partitioning protein ParB [Pantoea sp.]
MTNLARIYDKKAKTETNITTRKTYLLGVDELYVESGYNIREIDQTHVEEFRDAFIAGEHVPPLAVQVTEQGIKIIDGHHRYHGALLAKEAGYDIRLECKDFVGSEADRIAFMVTSSQGRALEPLERAAAYQRMSNQGMEPAEIAKKVKRSIADVEHHLQLLTSGDELIAMVKNREVAATTAVALVREHGVKAGSVARTQLERAKATGKKKLTKADAMPQFSAARARRLVELLCDAQKGEAEEGKGEAEEGKGALLIDLSHIEEVMAIITEYRSGIPAGAAQPAVNADSQYDENMPLTRAGILEQSGVEVWACAAAMFGDKDIYPFQESRYAHTWAADSFENPAVVVVPAEILAKAQRLKQKKLENAELKAWVVAQYPDLDDVLVMEKFNRFSSIAIETRLNTEMTMAQFIALVERTDRSNWDNIRMLRAAVAELVGQISILDIGEIG